MNKKAFTLIELLAVILVLGLIAIIATPIVQETIKDTKEQVIYNNIVNIKKAARTYYNQTDMEGIYVDKYKEHSIDDLINYKLINPISNPFGSGDCTGSFITVIQEDLIERIDVSITCGDKTFKSDM